MKILKSQLQRIIKEEYERIVSEAEGDGYGVYPGKRGHPLERRRFKSKEEAEAYLADLRKQGEYSSKSFDPGGRYGLEVRPYPAEPGPAPIVRGSEAEIAPMLDQLRSMLGGHDWYYERADDSRYYYAGRDEASKIRSMMDKLTKMGAGEEAQAMYDEFAKRAFPNYG